MPEPRPPASYRDPRLGTTLRGKYRLDRVLGEGGMAVVYAATHRNKKQFAVKILHADLSRRADVRERFVREGLSANSLNHPGAVAVLDDDVAEDGAAFLVMELLHGEGVERIWARHNYILPLAAVLAIGDQLLDVLASAHTAGVVHRDIKPANLYLSADGAVKVLDFGIARVRDAMAQVSTTTSTGALLGTPGFMAPEQALGETELMDGRTDVWAAGATLFALLAGEHVYIGDNPAKLLIQSGTTPARSLAAVAPKLPPNVVSIIDRALQFEQDSRWPTASAMRDALRNAYALLYGKELTRAVLEGLARPTPLPMPTPSSPILAGSAHESEDADAAPDSTTVALPIEVAALASSAEALGDDEEGPPTRREQTLVRPRPAISPPVPPVDLGTSIPVASDTPLPGRRGSMTPRFIVGGLAAGTITGAVIAWLFVYPSAPPVTSASPPASASSVAAAPSAPPVVAPSAPAATPSVPPVSPPQTAASVPLTPTRAGRPSGKPCKLVKSIDKAGEPHFSCPCARGCQ
jgi:serine/threonine protein kinase